MHLTYHINIYYVTISIDIIIKGTLLLAISIDYCQQIYQAVQTETTNCLTLFNVNNYEYLSYLLICLYTNICKFRDFQQCERFENILID